MAMKKLNIVLVILIIFSAASFAGNSDPIDNKLQKATNGYIDALQSENPGIRNSALHQLTILKAKYPNYDLTKVEKQVKRLSKKDSELLIRVNAEITYRYLTNKDLGNRINIITNDPKTFFKELYSQVSDIEKVF